MLFATLFAKYKCIGELMLLATLFATNKCVDEQIVKMSLLGGATNKLSQSINMCCFQVRQLIKSFSLKYKESFLLFCC